MIIASGLIFFITLSIRLPIFINFANQQKNNRFDPWIPNHSPDIVHNNFPCNQNQMDSYDKYAEFERIISYNGITWSSDLNLTSYLSGNGSVDNPFIISNFDYQFNGSFEYLIALDIQFGENIILQNCNFQGSSIFNFNTNIAVLIRSSKNIVIENCSFHMFTYDFSLFLQNVNNSIIRSCSFQYNEISCFSALDCNQIQILHNSACWTQEFDIGNSVDGIIFNNSFSNMAEMALHIYDCDRFFIENNSIQQALYGIYGSGPKVSYNSDWLYYGPRDCIIMGNFIFNCTHSGIHMKNAINNTFSNNIIRNCREIGINLDECFDSLVDSNTFQSIGKYGINMTKCGYLTIRNNKFEDIGLTNINPYKMTWEYYVIIGVSIGSIVILAKIHQKFQRKKHVSPTSSKPT